ncbi:hypothetical protein ACWCXC_19160 [Streptomyces sp. NPDC001515]
MTEQTIITTTPADGNTIATASRAGSFAPHVSTHPVAALTLGRQAFNDSDKANYFEG